VPIEPGFEGSSVAGGRGLVVPQASSAIATKVDATIEDLVARLRG
jgi:hypothetical protein